ncbi:cell division topological specificity factor MinE [Helicobacter sp. MIT 14-3879]|nr:cell division topological specificity factor MinE [Helicobacter sp. MIT 14-3879]RDU64865.1 cell division topological specificity factor MinE [Helicobacter sp. MIT 14-3879]
MDFLSFFNKKNSASKASERLKIILAHERSSNIPYINEMRNEIIEVIKKYTKANKINFKTDSNQNINMLEIEITLV